MESWLRYLQASCRPWLPFEMILGGTKHLWLLYSIFSVEYVQSCSITEGNKKIGSCLVFFGP